MNKTGGQAGAGQPLLMIHGFTLQELDAARRYGLPIVTIIHNNAAWGIIRAGQQAQFGFEMGTSLDGSDYAEIARGFGCHGEAVSRPQDFAWPCDVRSHPDAPP